ncbi:MAG: hypothetical protein R3C61_27020 [Bacteroidia bacterium]
MEIDSALIRGEEWLSSTPLHVLLYRAFRMGRYHAGICSPAAASQPQRQRKTRANATAIKWVSRFSD